MPPGPPPTTSTRRGAGARAASSVPSRPVNALTAQRMRIVSMESMQLSHEMQRRISLVRPVRALSASSGSASSGRPITIRSALPVAQDRLGELGPMDATDGHHGHVDDSFDGRGGRHVVGVAVAGAGDHLRGEAVDHAAAHVEGIDTGFHQPGRDELGVFDAAPARDPLVARDAQREREIGADLLLDRLDDLDDQALDAPLGPVATIVVGATVAPGRQERPEQHVTVRRVQLEPVVAGLACTRRAAAR